MAKAIAVDESTLPLRTLSAAELQTYHEQGYVILDDVFPPEDVTAINEELERLLPEYGDTEEHRPGWIFQLGLRSELLGNFARDERILSLIEDIVRPGIAITLRETRFQGGRTRTSSATGTRTRPSIPGRTIPSRSAGRACPSGCRCRMRTRPTAACGSCRAATAGDCRTTWLWTTAPASPPALA